MEARSTTQGSGEGCGCCAKDPVHPARDAIAANAAMLGIDGPDLRDLLASVDAGDCRATRDLMAAQVGTRLVAAQERVLESIGATAQAHRSAGEQELGMPSAVFQGHHDTVSALDAVRSLQAAAEQLAHDAEPTACTADCPCAATIGMADDTGTDTVHKGFIIAEECDGSPIACTLEGGIDAMRTRISDWQDVVGRATSREALAGGVTLNFDHNEQLTIELARLAAAEFACCSFFTFALTVSPNGMSFTVTAPPAAGDVVTAMFGAYGPVLVGVE